MSAHHFPAARVRYADRVLSQTLAGEAVVLDLKRERYYGLNSLGTRIWGLIGEHGDVDRILETLVVEYDAPADVIAADLHDLLAQLVRDGLVEADTSRNQPQSPASADVTIR
jgi:hypothetical protein